jgi:hypothetical protein
MMPELIIYFIENYTYRYDHALAWVFGIAVVAFWIWSLVYVANKKTEDSTQKLCWLLILLFFGPFGTLLYFMAGRDVADKRRKEREEAEFERFVSENPDLAEAHMRKNKT